MNILIINGHPDRESFCHGLNAAYKKGAEKKGNEVKEIILSNMTFNPVLMYGYRKRTELEPDLLDAREKIIWADHIVWIYPNWWGSVPALLKGFIDRVFLPRFAFEYRPDKYTPKKLLKGKTSEIISTMDSPTWWYSWVLGDPGGKMIRTSLGAYCGIKNIRNTYFAVVKTSTAAQKEKWLKKVERIAQV